MKKILMFLMSLPLFGSAQLYQSMPQRGYGPVKWFWIDSGLVIPTNVTGGTNLSGGREAGKVRYNITDSSFQVYTGYQWLAGNRSTSTGWGLTGNSGTTAGTNFVGTTDAQHLILKSNSTTVLTLASTEAVSSVPFRMFSNSSDPSVSNAGDIYYNTSSTRFFGQANGAYRQFLMTGDAVTSIATTSPITGGTITSTGTIACATCVTSAASLTSNNLVIGGGSQATSVTTTGTGVLTALGVNTGSAGAFVVNGGALGTPSSGTLTNATGLPEGGLSTTDVTTNNTSTTKHGFFPKLTSNSVYYVNNSGALTALALGTSGKVLTSNGTTSAPTFETPSSFTLTNGNGTTANGTAVDLGGTLGADMAIDGNYNFDIGRSSAVAQFRVGVSGGIELNGGSVQMNAYGAGAATFDASGNISSVSDIRLKNKRGNYSGGLKELMKINPIIYKWKPESGMETKHDYIGFSAQNIRSSLGEDAIGINKQGYLSIQDRAILAAAINAIQELKELNDKQQKEINNLKQIIKMVSYGGEGKGFLNSKGEINAISDTKIKNK